MSKFDPKLPTRTRSGKKVTIFTTDATYCIHGKPYPILFQVEGDVNIHSATEEGLWDTRESNNDLVNVDPYEDKDVVTTKDGHKVLIFTRDAPGRYPIIGWFINPNITTEMPAELWYWTKDGERALGRVGDPTQRTCALAKDHYNTNWDFKP